MTIHIIACGETGSKWDGEGPSIGVNDCYKWGHSVDYLVLVNAPGQFQGSRLEMIGNTPFRKLYTNMPQTWSSYFETKGVVMKVEKLFLSRWSKGNKLNKNNVYHGMTSPFVAVSLAHHWGFNKIVMWGVDLVNHHRYGKKAPGHVSEMMRFKSFFHELHKAGTQVYLGSLGTAFDNLLPVFNKERNG